jgi:hypothetical protein
MSVPLDIQRKCERRWRARIARAAPSLAYRERRPKGQDQQLALSAKAKQVTDQVEATGSKPPQAA